MSKIASRKVFYWKNENQVILYSKVFEGSKSPQLFEGSYDKRYKYETYELYSNPGVGGTKIGTKLKNKNKNKN